MKKRDFYVGIVSLALGIILIAMGFVSRSDAGGLLSGLGGGLTGAAIGVILRWRTLQSTSQSDFAKHVRRTNIAQQDERSVMLRGRSAYITLNILSVVLGLGWVVFEALHLLNRWTPFSGHAAAFCIVLFLLMWLCYCATLFFLDRRS